MLQFSERPCIVGCHLELSNIRMTNGRFECRHDQVERPGGRQAEPFDLDSPDRHDCAHPMRLPSTRSINCSERNYQSRIRQ
jgi:hypothetical protein